MKYFDTNKSLIALKNKTEKKYNLIVYYYLT